MKKIILFFLFIFPSLFSTAQERQVDYLRLSPQMKIETKIGVVDVELKYCRPSMRGRKIFGGLETYDQVWRTGANKNTKITFGDNVIIGDQELEAGEYSLFTRPNKNHWEVYFHTLLDEYGAPKTLAPENIIASITVPAQSLERDIETLSISFENLTHDAADLTIAWERTMVQVSIKVPTYEVLQKRLDNERMVLSNDYSTAAFNLFDKIKDSKNALVAINHAIDLMMNNQSFDDWLKAADLSDRHLPSEYTKTLP